MPENHDSDTEEMSETEIKESLQRISRGNKTSIHDYESPLPNFFKGDHFYLNTSLNEKLLSELNYIITICGGFVFVFHFFSLVLLILLHKTLIM